MTQSFLSIENLCKAFGSKVVLDGVSLDVAKGESLVIIGGSGTGKSVLLKSILGLMAVDSGTIHLDGKNLTDMSAAEREQEMRRFGMLFQGGALFDSLTVWQNIAFAPMQRNEVDRKGAIELAKKTLQEVGLKPEVADLSPSELSGGMQKRVALARAVATNPDIIFFDEPTTGLDPIMADVINDLISRCTRDQGRTALTITHDMASARKIGDRVAMLYQGKVIWHGTVEEMDACDNDYVQQFIHGRADGPI